MRLLFIVCICLFSLLNIKAQEITMFQGFGLKFYEDNVRISKKEANRLLLGNRASRELWKKAKKQRYGSIAGLVTEAGFMTWATFRALNYKPIMGPYLAGLGSAGVSLGFTYKRLKLEREAILAYNESLD